MKLKRIIIFIMLLSTVSMNAMAADSKEMSIYANAGRDTLITIEDADGNRFVYQRFTIIENSLGLSVELINVDDAAPGMRISPYAETIIISGRPDSYTITSENDDLLFSIYYQEHGFTAHCFAGDSLATLVENGELSAYTITSARAKPVYSINIRDDSSAISMSVVAKDNTLAFSTVENNSFTIQGAESYAPISDGYLCVDKVMDNDILLVQFEFIGNSTDGTKIPFTDVVRDDWFYDAVETMYWLQVMTGADDTTFCPNAPVTRGGLVTILYRMEGNLSVPERHEFDDVSGGAYNDAAVSWALEKGIITGYSDTSFGPDDSVTREQFVTIISRYIKTLYADMLVAETGTVASSFTDYSSVAEYARESMEKAVKYGWVFGKTETTLDPQGILTRAEAAAIITRIISNVWGPCCWHVF